MLASLAVVLAVAGWPSEASADPRCPAGYKVVHDKEDDSEYADADGLICLPEDRPLDGDYYHGAKPIWHFWGAVILSEPDGILWSGSDYRTRQEAERATMKSCKEGLKSKNAKGKCRVMGSWYNGDAFVAKGDDNRFFLDWSAVQATAKCNAQATGCAIKLSATSFGSASGER